MTEGAAVIPSPVVGEEFDFLPPGARHRPDLVHWRRMMVFRRPENLPVDFGD